LDKEKLKNKLKEDTICFNWFIDEMVEDIDTPEKKETK